MTRGDTERHARNTSFLVTRWRCPVTDFSAQLKRFVRADKWNHACRNALRVALRFGPTSALTASSDAPAPLCLACVHHARKTRVTENAAAASRVSWRATATADSASSSAAETPASAALTACAVVSTSRRRSSSSAAAASATRISCASLRRSSSAAVPARPARMARSASSRAASAARLAFFASARHDSANAVASARTRSDSSAAPRAASRSSSRISAPAPDASKSHFTDSSAAAAK